MALLKKTVVAILILGAAAGMALISYSFLTAELAQRGTILREGTGVFWDADRPPRAWEEAPRLGYLAPEIALVDLRGERISLRGLRGRPVLLNFWASWCPPCRAEIPALQEFYERYRGDVAVVGVNWSESPEEVRTFLERFGVGYPNLLDRQGKAFVTYRLTGVPTTFFLDEQGLIRGVWFGPLGSPEEIAAGFARIAASFSPEGRPNPNPNPKLNPELNPEPKP